ncbi:outer membrane biogenesis protein BamB [Anatilimnocola aggregata]|uniref:Outer membrane biogenesis protein BamB n=1 Tax=Anatilimnocola aggregata TaxID=2528021 RepID=A0A517Y873_9BACT|nr:PQQ-binding-like beta-propeller repeat protein [Anatilimnocola aggregata]QDU26426.1 outer membrane biogenesis protein BamB [Anatilimnocola aggregata]
MRRWFACSLFVLLFGGMLASHAAAQEWTRFRGPNGTGESEATTVPGSWTDKDYNWVAQLPGIGHSSPVIWKDKIFLLSADPKTAARHVLCLNSADGKIVWQRDFPGVVHHLHVRSSFASCTPCVDESQVYVAWSDPDHTWFKAFDHDGNEKWSLDLGSWVSQHGFGQSPMIYNDLVIITCSQEASKQAGVPEPRESFIVAVDKATGKQRWRKDCVIDTASYSVPTIRKNESGADELVMASTGEGLFAVDPATGKTNWASKVFKMRTISSPQLVSGLIFGTTGSGGGGNYVVAVRPGPTPEIAYEIKKEAPYVPTPVARGNLMFLWSDKGIVTCINAEDGSKVWQQRIGGVGNSGSPIRVNDKIYCVDEAGMMVVLGAGNEYKLHGKMDLKEECRSTPAVSDGRLYIRTLSKLYSIGGKSGS